MASELERLAYEAALRGLDKQERLLEAMRARTGVLLAVSSLGASFLGQQAFRDPSPSGMTILTLMAFVISSAASVFILLPKKNLVFSEAGSKLYEGLFNLRYDTPEVYRRLAYELDRLWTMNDSSIKSLADIFTVAAGALALEIVSLAVLWSDTLI